MQGDVEGPVGFEPTTGGLKVPCSATELRAHARASLRSPSGKDAGRVPGRRAGAPRQVTATGADSPVMTEPTPEAPERVGGARLIRLALIAQLADLGTFLIAVIIEPGLVSFELGPIGAIYALGGPVAATAFKLAGLAVVFAALALYHGRLTRLILVAVVALGALGAAANVQALLVARQIL